jgi:hypothetical protein
MTNVLQTMSPPRHQQWSLTANVAEGGDTTNHFANGLNTLWQTTAKRVLRTYMLVPPFGAWRLVGADKFMTNK